MTRRGIPELDRRRAITSLFVEAFGVMKDYSFSEILYSTLRKLKPPGTSVGWLRDVSDERIFSAIDDLIEEERELEEEGEENGRED